MAQFFKIFMKQKKDRPTGHIYPLSFLRSSVLALLAFSFFFSCAEDVTPPETGNSFLRFVHDIQHLSSDDLGDYFLVSSQTRYFYQENFLSTFSVSPVGQITKKISKIYTTPSPYNANSPNSPFPLMTDLAGLSISEEHYLYGTSYELKGIQVFQLSKTGASADEPVKKKFYSLADLNLRSIFAIQIFKHGDKSYLFVNGASSNHGISSGEKKDFHAFAISENEEERGLLNPVAVGQIPEWAEGHSSYVQKFFQINTSSYLAMGYYGVPYGNNPDMNGDVSSKYSAFEIYKISAGSDNGSLAFDKVDEVFFNPPKSSSGSQSERSMHQKAELNAQMKNPALPYLTSEPISTFSINDLEIVTQASKTFIILSEDGYIRGGAEIPNYSRIHVFELSATSNDFVRLADSMVTSIEKKFGEIAVVHFDNQAYIFLGAYDGIRVYEIGDDGSLLYRGTFKEASSTHLKNAALIIPFQISTLPHLFVSSFFDDSRQDIDGNSIRHTHLSVLSFDPSSISSDTGGLTLKSHIYSETD